MVNLISAINVVIQGISLSFVIKFDKIKFNTNNYWENDIPPTDYKNVLEKTYTSNWINEFHDEYQVIKINNKHDLMWMKKANEISCQTGKFTELYDDELKDFINRDENNYSQFFTGKEYFVRSENVSLKYESTFCKKKLASQDMNTIHTSNEISSHSESCKEWKPYTNFKSIIKSMLSCINGHTPIYKDTTEIKLYLLPWLNINKKQEFRVFVYNKKITAISQKNLYQRFENDCSYDNLEKIINNYVTIISTYFYDEIIHKIDIDNFTYDFAILDYDTPYFIELNSFGKEYDTGSSLYYWIIDDDILRQNTDIPTIYFRYTF